MIYDVWLMNKVRRQKEERREEDYYDLLMRCTDVMRKMKNWDDMNREFWISFTIFMRDLWETFFWEISERRVSVRRFWLSRDLRLNFEMGWDWVSISHSFYSLSQSLNSSLYALLILLFLLITNHHPPPFFSFFTLSILSQNPSSYLSQSHTDSDSNSNSKPNSNANSHFIHSHINHSIHLSSNNQSRTHARC